MRLRDKIILLFGSTLLCGLGLLLMFSIWKPFEVIYNTGVVICFIGLSILLFIWLDFWIPYQLEKEKLRKEIEHCSRRKEHIVL